MILLKKVILYPIILGLILLCLPIDGISASQKPEYEIAREDGIAYGKQLGELYGFRDYLSSSKNDWIKACPSNDEIDKMYNLDKETQTYRVYFRIGFREGFKEGYEKGFRSNALDAKQASKADGINHGEFFGLIEGEIYGRKDFYEGKVNDWKKSLPSESRIKSFYNLPKDTKEYMEGFLIGYRIAYEEAYTRAFRNSNVDNIRILMENAIEHGNEVGQRDGEASARIDYLKGKSNNWKSAILSDRDIIRNYQLSRESEEYRQGFLAGYKDGFKISYVETFQHANMDMIEERTSYTEISMFGGIVTSKDNSLSIGIDTGTFHIETFISIEKGEFSPIFTKKYSPVSYVYTVKTFNKYDKVELRNPITLTFDYYGTENGGIYELRNNQWTYLPSKVSEGMISTKIINSEYRGGTYAVFIDDEYKNMTDLSGHWAEEEIYTFTRRYYLSGHKDGTFKPESNITRGEFVTILDRMYNWRTPAKKVNITDFKDHMIFGTYSNSIANAFSRGYISGYSDMTFRPHMPITYREIELLVKRLPGCSDFKWTNMSDFMMYDRYTRSKSNDSLDNYISRAEVVFLLHHLQDRGSIPY